ncbi:tyrosine-type recombinase/integrase [Rhodobaculum claviforme]|uniref:Tyr recombinase domain-containing protein n=1 Tax=Rhodobaculum claviforme TaxID=1549854 RepID=A0A934WKA3_9RHOB|nr:integrase family protein [Rhodobaculum claviforme]MBK5928348.1 hypothetical protein [Rhodobaculum claviforme]
MAHRKKITDTLCRTAEPDAKYWDTEVRGFALFTGKTSKTFYFQKDVRGRTQRTKIGAFPLINAGQARMVAMELAVEHSSGVAARRLTAAKIPTLEQALETYLARPKLRSDHNRTSVETQMRIHLKSWLHLPLNEITKGMAVEAHRRISEPRVGRDALGRETQFGGERAANHVLKSFRAIYNHARRVHDLPECPTMAIEWHEETPSGVIISDLPRWKAEIEGLENEVHTAFYRFLLFTGLRLDEARTLRWDQVRRDHLHLPSTKNGRAFDLPLLDAHHAILDPMRAYQSEYVFHGRRQAKHLKSPARITWSPHAHRRTFATVGVTEAGLLEETVGRLLNHTPTSVTGAHYVVVDHEKLREPMTRVVSALERKGLHV